MTGSQLLSVIVPVFNEEATIVSIMEKLSRALPDAEMIYVDDGSADASRAKIEAHIRSQDCVLTQPNGGKGSAVLFGLRRAHGVYTVIQDADLEYDPNDIRRLLDVATAENAIAVISSRRPRRGKRSYARLRYYIGGVISTWCFNLLFLRYCSDIHSCYKIVRTDVLRSLPLREKGFGFDTELVALLVRRGIRLPEVGISYNPRSRMEGKKITWRDFFRCACVLLRLRFFPLPVR